MGYDNSREEIPSAGTRHSSHNILTIPPELFERIAELVKTLRLVSHDADQKVIRTYLETHFSERAFLLCSEDSLRMLTNISSHEIFGRSIRKLILCLDDISEDANRPSSEDVLSPANGKLSRKQRSQKRDRDKEFRRTLEAHETMRKHGEDLKLLARAFTSLVSYGNVPEILVTDYVSLDEGHVVGAHSAIGMLTGRYPYSTVTNEMNDSVSYRLVINALVLSDLPVKKITFDADNWSLKLDPLFADEALVDRSKIVFGHLTVLSVQVGIDRTSSDSEVEGFVNVLSSASNITHLTMRSHMRSNFEPLTMGHRRFERIFASHANFPYLEDLVLDRFVLTLQESSNLIRRHESLKSVRFENCVFHDLDTVRDLSWSSHDDATEVLSRITGLRDILQDELCDEIGGRAEDELV